MATVRQTIPAEGSGAPVSPAQEARSSRPGGAGRPQAERSIDERFEALLRQVQANRPNEDISLIRKAWEFCVAHHEGQMRA